MTNNDQLMYDVDFYGDRTYDVIMYMPLRGTLFKTIFNKSKPALEKKGVSIDNKFEEAESFDIPDLYLNSIRTFISSRMKKVIIKKYEKIGLKIKDFKVILCRFEKKDLDWEIRVTIKGKYEDKR